MIKRYKYILGIETSCDETAASVIKTTVPGGSFEVLSNVISSQIEIHQKYGGVIPEIAAREHVLNILPVIDEALQKAGIKAKDLEAIGVTAGPGLITSLTSGIETAKSLAFVWGVPIIPINHIAGHIYANFIDPKNKIKFPAVILTVSGGHTILLSMDKNQKIKIIGETRDDAAGEAYDKAAKMLGIGYPGGPIISKLAEEYSKKQKIAKTNRSKSNISKSRYSIIKLPRPMIDSNNFDFSFSGLKTALLYELQKDKDWKKRIPEYCFEFQQAIIETLAKKTIKAAKKFQAKTIMLAGGVSANKQLRAQLALIINNAFNKKVAFLVPNLVYTTDNAAMIAAATFFKLKKSKPGSLYKIKADPGSELK